MFLKIAEAKSGKEALNSVINAKSISAMIVMRFSIAQNVASLHVATVGSSSFVKYAMNHFAPIVGRSTIVLNVTFLHVTIVERLPLVISVGSLFVQKLEIGHTHDSISFQNVAVGMQTTLISRSS